LRDIKPGDKLYIMLHGPSQADGFLGASRKNGMKRYTPEQLARVLQREGLAKNITDIRLYACGSAIVGQEPAMAERLKQALVQRGYQNIAVYGYLGDVGASYAPRVDDNLKISSTAHKGAHDLELANYVRASHRRVRF
jgi:hypothetical protein